MMRGEFEWLRPRAPENVRANLVTPAWETEVIDGSLLIRGAFEFYGTEKDAETANLDELQKSAFVSVRAVFMARYVLGPGEDFTNEDAQAFARLNGQLNLHPYWREFVHTSLARMGCGELLIPPFNPFKEMLERKAAAQNRPPAETLQSPDPKLSGPQS
jgi:hypothetical protein